MTSTPVNYNGTRRHSPSSQHSHYKRSMGTITPSSNRYHDNQLPPDMTDTSNSSMELSAERNINENYNRKAKSDVGISNLTSPNSIMGLNVRDLASRYGSIGANSTNMMNRRRYNISPTRGYNHKTISANKEQESKTNLMNGNPISNQQTEVKSRQMSRSPIGNHRKVISVSDQIESSKSTSQPSQQNEQSFPNQADQFHTSLHANVDKSIGATSANNNNRAEYLKNNNQNHVIESSRQHNLANLDDNTKNNDYNPKIMNVNKRMISSSNEYKLNEDDNTYTKKKFYGDIIKPSKKYGEIQHSPQLSNNKGTNERAMTRHETNERINGISHTDNILGNKGKKELKESINEDKRNMKIETGEENNQRYFEPHLSSHMLYMQNMSRGQQRQNPKTIQMTQKVDHDREIPNGKQNNIDTSKSKNAPQRSPSRLVHDKTNGWPQKSLIKNNIAQTFHSHNQELRSSYRKDLDKSKVTISKTRSQEDMLSIQNVEKHKVAKPNIRSPTRETYKQSSSPMRIKHQSHSMSTKLIKSGSDIEKKESTESTRNNVNYSKTPTSQTVNSTPQKQSIGNMKEKSNTPISISPSRKTLHERIKKFDVSGEVPLPVCHYQMSQKGKNSHDREKMDQNGEENMEFEQLKITERDDKVDRVEDSRDKMAKVAINNVLYEEGNQSTKSESNYDQFEDPTIVDISLPLSVNEAKARLWDANEHLIRLKAKPNAIKEPNNEQSTRQSAKQDAAKESNTSSQPPSNDTVLARATDAAQAIRKTQSMDGIQSSNSSKPPFKSKLFAKAAEAAQTIRKTQSMDGIQSSKTYGSRSLAPNISNSRSFSPQSKAQKGRTIQEALTNEDMGRLDLPHTLKHAMSSSNATSIAKLVEKLASVQRDDPSAALRAIDSILQTESRGLGIIDENASWSNSQKEASHEDSLQDRANQHDDDDDDSISDKDELSSYDSDSDESSISAITDPTYQSGFGETASVYSTISRHGKKRHFSYSLKGKEISHFHKSHLSTRGAISHQNRKHEYRSSMMSNEKARSAFDTNFQFGRNKASATIMSQPFSRNEFSNDKPPTSPSKPIRGGNSTNNPGLLKTISRWDETSDDESIERPQSHRKDSKNQLISPPSYEDHIRELTKKEFAKRFMYPSQSIDDGRGRLDKLQLQREIREQQNYQSTQREAKLPPHVTSAFDDVSISFGSHNVFVEEEPSFLSPLAQKFSKVEQRIKDNHAYS